MKSAATRQGGYTRERRTVGEDGDGVSTASGEEEDGGDRRHVCSRFKMKPMLTSSSFRYKERGNEKAGTRAGGGRWGKMGTGCPLRRARRRTAATCDGDTFVQDEIDSDHLFFSV